MKEKSISLTCTSVDAGLRLDKFLNLHVVDYSRSFFQDLIDRTLVTVNGTATKSSYCLKAGDIIHLIIPPPKEYNLTPVPLNLSIIDVQDDFIIVDKPPHLCVHAADSNKDELSLVNGLLHQFKELAPSQEAQRPGIVHRLDKDTSGLLIVARTQPALIAFADMFKKRLIHKTYLAFVQGTPPLQGTINSPIGRHPTARHKMSPFGINARMALSHFTIEEYYPEAALVSITIETGRTHQIRVHLASISHPIIGDTVYGKAHTTIGRQALHAWKLGFSYKGRTYTYQAPLPEDFKLLEVALKK